MNQNLKKLTSMLASSLLTVISLIGLTALPANAVEPVQYDFETLPSAWAGFEGAWASSNESTPFTSESGAPSGTKSAFVQEQFAGGQVWAGVNIAARTTDEFISSSGKIVEMKARVPVGTVITLKLEATNNNSNGSTPTLYVEKRATATSSSWDVLRFDFSTTDAGTYTEGTDYVKAAVFINFGQIDSGTVDPSTNPNGLGSKFYIDDLAFTPDNLAATAPVSSQTIQYTFETKPSGWRGFSGAEGSDIEATPAGSGAPTGTNSGYILETSGGDNWQGLVVDERTSSELISASSKTVQIKVKAPSGMPVTLKLESPGNDVNGGTPSLYVQKTVNTSGTAWETLTFDFASPDAGVYTEASNYVKVVLFFNLNAKNDSAGKMYFDDLAFTPNAVTLSSSSSSSSSSSTPESSFVVDPDNKGKYPHIRLDKSFLDTKFDASWWDGVWQYRDSDTKAYLKYIPVTSTFKLTYVVTDADNQPMIDVPVTLTVNANYSCSKTFFMYENSLIGPDDCSGGGETVLPAKRTDSWGRVSFVLTNTNTVGEAMPADLNGLPNGKELGTNIKPHLVGATQEGIDMLFAHFVQPTEKASVKTSGNAKATAGEYAWSTFTFTDENGKPIVDSEVAYMINGFDSKSGYASTDRNGNVLIRSGNSAKAEGTQVVSVSLIRPGKLPLTGSVTVNWSAGAVTMAASGAKGAVVVNVANANGKSVKISVGGKVYTRTATSNSTSFRIPATAGSKKVVITVAGKSVTKTVTVSK